MNDDPRTRYDDQHPFRNLSKGQFITVNQAYGRTDEEQVSPEEFANDMSFEDSVRGGYTKGVPGPLSVIAPHKWHDIDKIHNGQWRN